MWPFTKHRRCAPAQLPEPPEWMVERIQRQTGKSPAECRRILSSPTLAEYWELTGDGPSDDEEQCDPIELDPDFAAPLLRATIEAEREVGEFGDYGHCYVFWDCKKQILRRRYGVKWQDPSDINPDTDYD
jgi:hypothetical protein